MRILASCACLFVVTVVYGGIESPDIINRGDANNDGSVNLADPVMISNYLFRAGDPPPCLNQADANDDGSVNLADTTYLYNFLFGSGPEPPFPGIGNTECSIDPAPNPGCDADLCD